MEALAGGLWIIIRGLWIIIIGILLVAGLLLGIGILSAIPIVLLRIWPVVIIALGMWIGGGAGSITVAVGIIVLIGWNLNNGPADGIQEKLDRWMDKH